MGGVSADVLQSAGITIVRVDTADFAAVVSSGALDVGVAVALRIALALGVKGSDIARRSSSQGRG